MLTELCGAPQIIARKAGLIKVKRRQKKSPDISGLFPEQELEALAITQANTATLFATL